MKIKGKNRNRCEYNVAKKGRQIRKLNGSFNFFHFKSLENVIWKLNEKKVGIQS